MGKKFAGVLLLFVVIVGAMGAYNITEKQSLVTGALDTLGFEFEQPPNNRIGGDMTYKVTADTLKELKVGTKIIVNGNGSVRIVNVN